MICKRKNYSQQKLPKNIVPPKAGKCLCMEVPASSKSALATETVFLPVGIPTQAQGRARKDRHEILAGTLTADLLVCLQRMTMTFPRFHLVYLFN
ncbi:MAG: hypothetical protein WBP54_02600 [Pelodictyon phaeoclathratiforme]